MNIKIILTGFLACGGVASGLLSSQALANEKQCVVILAAEQKEEVAQKETTPPSKTTPPSSQAQDPAKLCGCIYTQSTANANVQAEIITSDGLPKKKKRTEALNKIIETCRKAQQTEPAK